MTLLTGPSGAKVTRYDLVLMGGRVIDPETSFDGVRNVGISDGRIAILTDAPIVGRDTIDATGLVVAPGFIDISYDGAISPFGVKLALRDGCTTQMSLEAGALNVEGWYAERAGKWQANYGTSVSLNFARRKVLDHVEARDVRDEIDSQMEARADGEESWLIKVSDLDQLNDTLTLLDLGLQQGALGVGIALDDRAVAITGREVLEAQRLAGAHGRMAVASQRFVATGPTNALPAQELLANALAVRAPLVITNVGYPGWPMVHELTALARSTGLVAWTTVDPYRETFVSADAPWLSAARIERHGVSYERDLFDPVSGSAYDEARFREVRAAALQTVVGYRRPETWISDWLRLPGLTIASRGPLPEVAPGKRVQWVDPWGTGAGHPSAAGTHARTLRLAREANVPLLHTLSQLSYWTAQYLGDAGVEQMKERGRVQEGMVADLVLFDPVTVTDTATFEAGKNTLPSTGIPYVLVSGVPVVKGSSVQAGVSPGKAIRQPPGPARFEPLSGAGWYDEYALDVGPVVVPE